MTARRSRLLAVGLLLAAGGPGCTEERTLPPYGFATRLEQPLRYEAEGRLEVDGHPVTVERYADLRLVAELREDARTEIVLYLDRYYMRVDGAPNGVSELALSEHGMAARSPGQGEIKLGPEDARPGGGRVSELLERPVAGCFIGPMGEVIGEPWRSFDPILSGIELLEWILLGLPVLEASGESGWSARRRAPTIGQYQLGIDIPLRYERVRNDSEPSGQRIRMSGLIQRSALTVAPGFT